MRRMKSRGSIGEEGEEEKNAVMEVWRQYCRGNIVREAERLAATKYFSIFGSERVY